MKFLGTYLSIILLSMTPLGELRISIPTGIAVYKLPLLPVFFLSVIGNLIPVIFILLFLDKTSNFLMKRSHFFKNFFTWLFKRTHRKHSKKFEIYGEIALISFVAIPLPITGAWTGALAAFLFGVPIKRALLLILLGIIIAGIIVTTLTLSGINLLGLIKNA
jgi:uncharacterized membrane protein